MIEVAFPYLLLFAAVTTSLTAGLVLTFALLVMPGLGKLDDAAFIRAFQVIDGVIQNGQPIFAVVWLGSILSTFAAAALGFFVLEGWPLWLLLAAAVLYALAVQLPTFAINVPRNNRLQGLQVDELDAETLARERAHFEPTWNRWNIIRTWAATAVSVAQVLVVGSV